MKEQDLGRGQKIFGFSSQEDLYQFLEQNRQDSIDALSQAYPAQEAITYGDHVFRFVEPDLCIWGRIMVEDDFEDHDEWVQVQENRTELGLIYGKWFSEVVPEGEYGSAHIISCWPIRSIDFHTAGANGWRIWQELAQRIQTDVIVERKKKRNQEGSES